MTAYTDANRNRRGGEIPHRSLTIGISCKETRQWLTRNISRIVSTEASTRTVPSLNTAPNLVNAGCGPDQSVAATARWTNTSRSGRQLSTPTAFHSNSPTGKFPKVTTFCTTAIILRASDRSIFGVARIKRIWTTCSERGVTSRREVSKTVPTRSLKGCVAGKSMAWRDSRKMTFVTSVDVSTVARRKGPLGSSTEFVGHTPVKSDGARFGSASSDGRSVR